MIDITVLIRALITIAMFLITTFLIPWIKTKVSNEKLSNALKWTKVAVEAAEMIYHGVGLGDMKKQYVLEFLESHGYTFDDYELNNLVEAAVLELKKEAGINGTG